MTLLKTETLQTEHGIGIDYDDKYTTYTTENHELTATHLLFSPHQLILNSENPDAPNTLIKFDAAKFNPGGTTGDTTISLKREGTTLITLKEANITFAFSLLLTYFA